MEVRKQQHVQNNKMHGFRAVFDGNMTTFHFQMATATWYVNSKFGAGAAIVHSRCALGHDGG